MKLKNPLFYILSLLTTLPLAGNVARAATIQVLQTYDFPGVGNSTMPQKVSDQAVIINTLIKPDGTVQGFLYKPRIGRLSDRPYSAPDDTGNYTAGRGINNLRHAVGEYRNGSDGTFHGYLFKHPDFFNIDVPNAVNTIPLGINNKGDRVGALTLTDGTRPAYISLAGKITTFTVPGATATFAYQLNTTKDVIGYYLDAAGVPHGYTRDPNGNLAFPINAPGSTGTVLFGNNDLNWGVGRYTDASGATHGLFYLTPNDIQTYDYPGSTFTSLNGINKDGYVCGYYLDANGIAHGIWAKVDVSKTSNPSTALPVVPVEPAHPLSELFNSGMPFL